MSKENIIIPSIDSNNGKDEISIPQENQPRLCINSKRNIKNVRNRHRKAHSYHFLSYGECSHKVFSITKNSQTKSTTLNPIFIPPPNYIPDSILVPPPNSDSDASMEIPPDLNSDSLLVDPPISNANFETATNHASNADSIIILPQDSNFVSSFNQNPDVNSNDIPKNCCESNYYRKYH
ncbi:hypothetical protein M9Y10_018905 [Tritrichomonas musculus]|uniref:Uncharacterized protein n=1 Tax=Tritrichomonas musculus TaxID=1915356 RepID=A0ABR2HJB3_9EUKA